MGAGGSNPLSPTSHFKFLPKIKGCLFYGSRSPKELPTAGTGNGAGKQHEQKTSPDRRIAMIETAISRGLLIAYRDLAYYVRWKEFE